MRPGDPFSLETYHLFKHPPFEHPSFCNFNIIEVIGRGTYASVYRAMRGHLMYALKQFEFDSNVGRLSILASFDREIRAHAQFPNNVHRNITRLISLVLGECGVPTGLAFEYVAARSMVGRRFDLVILERIAHQVAEALVFTRRHHVIHGDIKPNNILVSDDGTVIKLCDFGLATVVESGQRARIQTYGHGTLPYTPPETVPTGHAVPFLTYASDIWSLGCVLFEAATCIAPFLRNDDHRTIQAIHEGAYTWPENCTNAHFRAIVDSMMRHDPLVRISLDLLLSSSLCSK